MCFLCHHSLVPIMFPRKKPNIDVHMKFHFGKGKAELINFDYSTYSGLDAWMHADFARNVASCRSTTSTCHKLCDIAFSCQCVKQPEPGARTNHCNMRSLFHTTREAI